MKRKFLLVLGLLFSVVTTLGVLAACGSWTKRGNNKEPGAEAGEYYCDYQDAEYSLTLGDGEVCTFKLTMGTTELKGDYALENDALTLTPENAGAISATYKNDRVTLTYSNVTYTFLRKIDYTVTFDTNGGTTIDAVTVRNGRTVAKPAVAPTKGELVFVGWYNDNTTFKNPFYFSQPITGNKTLYARFVEVADPEFTVSFDLGYENAVAPAAATTVNHRIYAGTLDTPVHPEGKEFLGWYVSDFENREKLTYEYTEDLEITQNLTLFAVWADGTPEVSVSAEGVKINAEGTNLTYDLRITPPAPATQVTHTGTLTTGAATVDTSFNFATAAEGEYKIEVDVNNKTTTRYFNNKALARVSVFKVDDATNRILLFNKVANATSYAISYECGSAGHEHVDDVILNDTSANKYISYDFSGCDMRAEGITFTVKALADGYVTSVSQTDSYNYILKKIENSQIELDSAMGTISWPEVEHATAYRVSVTLDGTPVVEDEDVAVCNYSITRFGKGELTISVVPRAFGWNSPEAAEYTYTKQTLAAPQNVHMDGITLKWDSVTGATGYELHIGDKMVPVTGENTTTYTIEEEDLGSEGSAEVTLYAVSAVEAEKSYVSDTLTVTNVGVVSGLTYHAGKATWNAILGADGYQWKIGEDGVIHTITDQEAEITFTAGGTQTIYVRALKNGGGFDWAHIDVTVDTIDFGINTAEIDDVPSIYLAEGDPIELPQPEWVGYDFDGWYRDGYNGTNKYEETTFAGGALTLYAKFTPKTFTITLVTGPEGKCDEDTFTVSYRQSNFTLPVPTPTSVEYTFQGWYRGVGGTGAQFADLSGGNTGTYTLLKDLTVYAKWTTPFVYTEVEGGLSISAGSSIGAVKEITIPATHNGKTVITVEDFNAGTSLEVINIPDTVKDISLGSVGKAFESLTKLKAVNIIQVPNNNVPKYASKDGMVYEKETNRLIYVPLAYKTSAGSTEVTLPDNITSIRTGAIYKNTTITKLTIPASVYELQTEAIREAKALESIIFTASAEDATLTIADKAFHTLAKLTTLSVPKYTVGFSIAKLEGCDAITDINILDSKAGDDIFSVNGVLCRTIKDTTTSTQEIIYYPKARTATQYDIPDGITSIGEAAFKNVTSLTSITIPVGITYIGKQAFYGCSGVTELTFDATKDSNDLTIDEEAFSGTQVTTLSVPANVVKAARRAFYISSLTKITLNGRPNMSVEYAPTGVFATVAADLIIGADFPVIDIASVFAVLGTTGNKPTVDSLKSINIDGNKNYVRVEGEETPGYGGIYNAAKTKLLYVESGKASVNFVVPEGVTEIGPVVFKGKGVNSIKIPASVTTIGDYAFQSLSSLTKVEFTTGTRSELNIGKYAFHECGNLSDITLPAETVSIGAHAFASCTSLKAITVPSKVREVGDDAFNSAGLTTITFEEGVQTLGESVLQACTALQTVKIPASMTIIGAETFLGCTDLTTITVADGSEYFKSVEGALYAAQKNAKGEVYAVTLLAVPIACTGTEGTLNIPETVSRVASRAMHYNEGIQTVQFADKVVAYDESGEKIDGTLVIEEYAFNGNSNGSSKLQTVSLPDGLTTIGENAFNNCDELTTINIPYTVTSIAKMAFYNCDKITTGLTFEATPQDATGVELKFAQSALSGMQGLTTLTLPERPSVEMYGNTLTLDTALETVTLPSTFQWPSVSTGGSGAYVGLFQDFTNLKTVNLPEEVPDGFVIGWHAFYGCTNLATIGTVQNVSIDGKDTPVQFLPEGITTIGVCAFTNTALKTIGIPSTFKEFAEHNDSNHYLFSGCTKLETIAFADNCELESLPKGFVTNASALKNVVFGKNMKLKTIGEEGKTSDASTGVFNGAAALTSITIPKSVEIIKDGAFQNLTQLTEVNFETGSKLAEIETSAFKSTGLTSFTFPTVTDENGEVQEIIVASGVFSGCVDLATMHLSASVQSVTGLFAGVTGLETVTADDETYYSIDADAHAIYGLNAEGEKDTLIYAYGVVEGRIVIDDGTLEIAEGTYKGQVDIEEVVLPASLIKIGAGAFENCVSLQKVSFMIGSGSVSSLSLIDSTAFKNCWALDDFEFSAAVNLSYIGTEAFYASGLKTLDLSKCVMLGSNAAGTALNGIGEGAFENANLLGTEMINPEADANDQYSVLFPASLKTIGMSAFRNTAITKVDLSKTQITSLPGKATGNAGIFMGCAQLKEVKLPVALKQIQATTFKDSGLETINLEELVNLTNINASAFNNTQLTRVVFPAAKFTASSSQGNVFANNTKLEYVDMSKATTIKTLGSSYFSGCSALETVILPSSLTEIGSSMFKDCISLTEIDIPENVTKIGSSAFAGCTALRRFDIPEGVEGLGTSAFDGCSNLEEVTFPTTLVYIGREFLKYKQSSTWKDSDDFTFRGTKLTRVDLSKTKVKSISGHSFQNVTTLTEVILPATFATTGSNGTLTGIGKEAFSGSGLTSITLPATYTTINDSAFKGAANLTSVTIQADQITVGASSFQDCTGLASFDFSKVSKTGSNAFQNTGFTQITVNGGITWGDNTFQGSLSLGSVTIASDVTKIPKSMFQACTALKSVTVQATGLTEIGNSAFSGCTMLDTITWPATLSDLKTLGTSLFKGTAVTTMDLSKMTNVNLVKLGNNFFQDCENLKTVTLPANITQLGNYAFAGCSALQSIDLSTMTSIGTYVLQNCTEITSVTLNNSITSIPNYAFDGCTSLSSITMNENAVTTIGQYSFRNTDFTTFKIGKAITTVNKGAFHLCDSLTAFTVDDQNTNFAVGTHGELYKKDADTKVLVAYPTGSTTFALADDVTELTDEVLAELQARTIGTFTIPSKITKIGQYAFKNTAMNKLIVPNGIETFLNYAFAESAIKEIEFQGSAEALNTAAGSVSYLFQKNSALTKVTFPAEFTKIGANWFLDCTGLTSFTIPASVTTVRGGAFKNTGITSISIPSTVTTLEASAFGDMPVLTEATIDTTFEEASITNMFQNDAALATVKFGTHITVIGDAWFKGLASLTKVVAVAADGKETENKLPDQITTIGGGAFNGTGITTITLPSGLTTIRGGNNGGAFADCANLKNLTLPDSLTETPASMCTNDPALEWVKLGENVATIGSYAFQNCASLKFVNLPERVSTQVYSLFNANTPNIHVFVPRTWVSFSAGKWWYPTETNHIYFGASKYETFATRGLAWIQGTSDGAMDLSGVSFDATYAQALKASGATDFPGYSDIVKD